jgi:hypothetical protein
MEFLIPLIIIGLLLLVPIAFWLARPDARKGPYPNDLPGPMM